MKAQDGGVDPPTVEVIPSLAGIFAAEQWHPQVGDPTIAGWVITFAYFLAGLAAFRAMRVVTVGSNLSRAYRHVERRVGCRQRAYKAGVLFWGMMILMLLFLGMNKQLDLQSWLTEAGRKIARWQGWYDRRQEIQVVVVVIMALAAGAVLTALLVLTRSLLPRQSVALVGMVALGVFAVVQAASFHHVDALFAERWGGVQLRWVLEVCGICLIGMCAVLNSRWVRRVDQGQSVAAIAAPVCR